MVMICYGINTVLQKEVLSHIGYQDVIFSTVSIHFESNEISPY